MFVLIKSLASSRMKNHVLRVTCLCVYSSLGMNSVGSIDISFRKTSD